MSSNRVCLDLSSALPVLAWRTRRTCQRQSSSFISASAPVFSPLLLPRILLSQRQNLRVIVDFFFSFFSFLSLFSHLQDGTALQKVLISCFLSRVHCSGLAPSSLI